MDWLTKLIENLPAILTSLAANTEGLIGFVWVIGAAVLCYLFKNAPIWPRTIVFLLAFAGVVYLVSLIISTNDKIRRSKEVGWTYYQVKSDGTLASPDGRLYLVEGQGRQYPDIRKGNVVKVADPDGAKLYSVPHKDDSKLITLTDGQACLEVLRDAGEARTVTIPGTGGWLYVQTIRCAGR